MDSDFDVNVTITIRTVPPRLFPAAVHGVTSIYIWDYATHSVCPAPAAVQTLYTPLSPSAEPHTSLRKSSPRSAWTATTKTATSMPMSPAGNVFLPCRRRSQPTSPHTITHAAPTDGLSNTPFCQPWLQPLRFLPLCVRSLQPSPLTPTLR